MKTKLTRYQAQGVGRILVEGSKIITEHYHKDWIKQKSPDLNINIRVGTGKSTYFGYKAKRKSPTIHYAHTLTYGAAMIESKYNADNACRWLTAREIKQFGFWGGEITITNLLVHVIAHELAHLFQYILYPREDYSVHNAEFYNILTRMCSSPVMQHVYEHVSHRMQQEGYPSVFNCGSRTIHKETTAIKIRK